MNLKNFRTYNLAVALHRQCETIKARAYVKDQLLRATLSAVLNTAEGSAKESPKDRARFYGIALASTREAQALLDLYNQKEALALADALGAHLYRLLHPRPSPR